jgi:hypothetical protein
MQPKQVKNDILAVLQTEKYFADAEFYRLLDDNSIPHSTRVSLMKDQLKTINEIVQCAKVLDAMLPEKQQSEGVAQTEETQQ